MPNTPDCRARRQHRLGPTAIATGVKLVAQTSHRDVWRHSLSSDDHPLQYPIATGLERSARVLQRDVVPDHDVTVAPAMFEHMAWLVEMIIHFMEQIAAVLPIHTDDTCRL